MTLPAFKQRFEEYTEAEFLQLLRAIEGNTKSDSPNKQELDRELELMVDHFEKVSGHPSGSDLIFWPEPGQDDSPEGILREVKRWRAEQGLPSFKGP